jgi:hypothetical protein
LKMLMVRDIFCIKDCGWQGHQTEMCCILSANGTLALI